MNSKALGLCLPLAVLWLSACAVEVYAPPDSETALRLSAGEAGAVTAAILRLAPGGSAFDPPAGTVARSRAGGGSGEISFGVEATADCAAGGSTRLSATVTGTFDPETGAGQFGIEGAIVAERCRIPHESTTITVSTDPDIALTGEAAIADGSSSGTLTYIGAFVFHTDDGRSGRCEVNVVITFDGDQRTVTGTVCGMDVGDGGGG